MSSSRHCWMAAYTSGFLWGARVPVVSSSVFQREAFECPGIWEVRVFVCRRGVGQYTALIPVSFPDGALAVCRGNRQKTQRALWPGYCHGKKLLSSTVSMEFGISMQVSVQEYGFGPLPMSDCIYQDRDLATTQSKP